MEDLKLFIPLTKVDEEKRLVFGRVTEEVPDSLGEIMDYATSKPFFQKWSDFFQKTTDGKSFGNLRIQHDAQRNAGHLTDIVLNDAEKAVDVCAKVNDEDEWKRLLDGDYTGFSVGGKYAKRWNEGGFKRYTADPSEISIVDYPALKTATFSLVKAGGAIESRSFHKKEEKAAPVQPENKKTQEGEVMKMEEKLGELKKMVGDLTGFLKDNMSPFLKDALGKRDEPAKKDEAGDLAKLDKAIKDQYVDPLAKALGLKDGEKPLEKIASLIAENDTLKKENAELKKQPEPAKGATKDLTKAQDSALPGNQVKEEPKDALGALKKAHSEPKMFVLRPALTQPDQK